MFDPEIEAMAAQIRREQEQWAAWNASQEQSAAWNASQVQSPAEAGSTPAAHVGVQRQFDLRALRSGLAAPQSARARIEAATAILAVRASFRLVQRSSLVTRDRVFIRMVSWWDILAPAWPVGDFPWYTGETHTRGESVTRIPTGVTAANVIVPLHTPYAGEVPVRTDPPNRPLPRFARVTYNHRPFPAQHRIEDLAPVAAALERIVDQVK